MIRVLASLTILAVSAMATSAQLLGYRSEVKNDGWKIHGFNELKLKKVSELKQSDGSILIERLYDARSRQPSTLLETTKVGKRITNILRFEFSWLYVYAMNGKTFAVDGSCVLVDYRYGRSHGHLVSEKSYLSGVTQYTFYDEDGDGKFERRYNSSPGDKNFKILIPEWVKK